MAPPPVSGGVSIRMTSCYYETGAWEAMVREWRRVKEVDVWKVKIRMTTGSDLTNLISRECIYCLITRSDLHPLNKVCIFYLNVCITLWVRLHPQAHGQSQLCHVHVRIITIQAAAHHLRWGWRLVNICICLVWIKISLCGCKCQTAFSESWLTRCLYSVLKNGTETQNKDGK